jgi:asparagine synthase (glutamine-hydrolysing)
MCGVAGVFNLNGDAVPVALLRRMTDRIAHRGPDGEGHYTDRAVGLGHRRLAIIDLSPAGHQPMANEAGTVVIVYNGEIYNFQKLRVELEALGHRFHSQTDSEVALHAYEQWGEACLERFDGMFAFAVYDRRPGGSGRLFLARDRYGVKPLYYAAKDGVFIFGSEVKALLVHPALSAAVDHAALSDYFTFQNTFGDRTLFEGVKLLEAGCFMVVDPAAREPVRVRRYWDYRFDHSAFALSFEDCANEVYRRFSRAVIRQMVADVPVGSYLSGGIDSGSIAAVASKQVPRLYTFTGGFDLSSASGLELGYDERPASEVMANAFKTEHYEVVLHAGDMEHILPKLVWHLEDLRVGQCYPNYYVARLAGKFVKVVLSGTGGDELFAGYPWRYFRGAQASGPDAYYQAYYDYWQRLVPDDERAQFFNDATYARLKDAHPIDTFRTVFAQGEQPLGTLEDVVNASLYFEIKTFLHGLFVVEDKLSMAHSLETRVPFMDNELVDFALKVPPRFKLSELAVAPRVDEDDPGKRLSYNAQPTRDGKRVMRHAMARLVPESIAQRTKQGFSAPDASWFRGESLNYVNALLGDRRARIYEFIEPAYVRRMLDEHCTGRINHRLLIWSFLSFEWWCRTFLP